MRYLEEKQVVHSDLAARNVLVSEERPGAEPVLVVKVADFGLARLVEPSKANELASKKTSTFALILIGFYMILNTRFFQEQRQYQQNGPLQRH